jgi:hypothetical protein
MMHWLRRCGRSGALFGSTGVRSKSALRHTGFLSQAKEAVFRTAPPPLDREKTQN